MATQKLAAGNYIVTHVGRTYSVEKIGGRWFAADLTESGPAARSLGEFVTAEAHSTLRAMTTAVMGHAESVAADERIAAAAADTAPIADPFTEQAPSTYPVPTAAEAAVTAADPFAASRRDVGPVARAHDWAIRENQSHDFESARLARIAAAEAPSTHLHTYSNVDDGATRTCSHDYDTEAPESCLQSVTADCSHNSSVEHNRAAVELLHAGQAPTYPYVNSYGRTVWACCVSAIGPRCEHTDFACGTAGCSARQSRWSGALCSVCLSDLEELQFAIERSEQAAQRAEAAAVAAVAGACSLTVAATLVAGLRADDGASVNWATGTPRDYRLGYMVSLPGHEFVYPLSARNDFDAVEFVTTAQKIVANMAAQPQWYGTEFSLGVWAHEGMAYFDISILVPELSDALALGADWQQIAIWDNDGGHEIAVSADAHV